MSTRTSKSRLPLIDAMKGIGCIAIVLHHLAFYGPMSDVVRSTAPLLMDGLFYYARLAVQMFFVLAGYLVAAQLAPDGHAANSPTVSLIWRRYKRLITPFLFAVALATLISALVRPWFEHDSLSAAPTLLQIMAHVLLLHDLLGFEALSAGVWYVAIDFQLFVLTVLLTALMSRAPMAWRAGFPIIIILLAAVSLWGINLDDKYENYAPYFFGAYGLGMLAYWSTRSTFGNAALIVLTVLGAVALWLQFRNPIAVALATALLVSIGGQRGWLQKWPRAGMLTWLGQRSYSIFLIHYGIVIAFNATWHVLFPTGVLINAIGIVAATLTSVAAGTVLYHYVEARREVFGLNAATATLAAMVAAALVIEATTW